MASRSEPAAAPSHFFPAGCTCDPEAYETGPEGQRRYFEDRYCPVHGEAATAASAHHPSIAHAPVAAPAREFCGDEQPHEPHEYLVGMGRFQCPGLPFGGTDAANEPRYVLRRTET